MRTYRELIVWQRAMDLVEHVYRVTDYFPGQERHGLTGQVQRAAVSVPANIAEGWGRKAHGDYLRFLTIARGSLMEVETHLIIAMRLGFITKGQGKPAWDCAQEVGKLLSATISSLRHTQPDH